MQQLAKIKFWLCKKSISSLFIVFLLTSCATVNFSSKYYTLPTNYKDDIEEVWKNVTKAGMNTAASGTKAVSPSVSLYGGQAPVNAPMPTTMPFKNTYCYSYKITQDNETQIPGIPQIDKHVISFPDYFIRYVYEFYYPKYHKQILTCIILHEIAHDEGGIDDKPPRIHYQCDKYAIDKLLPNSPYSIDDFYSSLKVVSDYWSARKGTGGHLFNIGWNALNIYAIALGGSGTVGDLFATDINTRLSLLKKDYPQAKFSFHRTK